MGKSAAANWAARWARGGRPDPLLGNSVPDRASNPKRQMTLKEYQAWSDEVAEKYKTEVAPTKPVKGKSRF